MKQNAQKVTPELINGIDALEKLRLDIISRHQSLALALNSDRKNIHIQPIKTEVNENTLDKIRTLISKVKEYNSKKDAVILACPLNRVDTAYLDKFTSSEYPRKQNTPLKNCFFSTVEEDLPLLEKVLAKQAKPALKKKAATPSPLATKSSPAPLLPAAITPPKPDINNAIRQMALAAANKGKPYGNVEQIIGSPNAVLEASTAEMTTITDIHHSQINRRDPVQPPKPAPVESTVLSPESPIAAHSGGCIMGLLTAEQVFLAGVNPPQASESAPVESPGLTPESPKAQSSTCFLHLLNAVQTEPVAVPVVEPIVEPVVEPIVEPIVEPVSQTKPPQEAPKTINLDEQKGNFNKLLTRLDALNQKLLDRQKVNKSYEQVAKVGKELHATLIAARDKFFETKPSTLTYEQFKDSCIHALNTADTDFSNHRGWHALNSVVRAILGFLSIVTFIPALAVAKFTHHGYAGTFFKLPATNSKVALDGLTTEFNQMDQSLPAELKTSNAPQV